MSVEGHGQPWAPAGSCSHHGQRSETEDSGAAGGRVDPQRHAAERERAEQAHREVLTLLNGILKSATEYAIAAIDRDFRVLHFNPAAEHLFGYPAERVIGRTLREIHSERNVPPRRL